MDLRIFSVYDEKAEIYHPPFYYNQVGQALRTFTDCINSADHQFGAHPSDYSLFLLGSFSDQNGHFDAHAPKSLGNGVEFIARMDSLNGQGRPHGPQQISNDPRPEPGSSG